MGRRLAVDAVLAVLVVTVVTTAVAANLGAEAEGPAPAAYAFGVVLGGLMMVRRRWPVTTLLATAALLVAYYVLGFPPIGLAVPVSAALYSAAEQGRTRWAVGTAAGLLALSTPARVVEGDDLSYLLAYETVTAVTLMAAVIAWGDSVRSRRGWSVELERQARAAEVEREREAERRVADERLRIARDLHDLLAHTISVISVHTDVAREAVRDDVATAERSLAAARGACADVVRELRATVGALRTPARHGDGSGGEPGVPGVPGELGGRGLDHLDELVRSVAATGLAVEVRTSGSPARLPSVTDTALYRVVQESLNNVVRHARAARATVDIEYHPTGVRLVVRDDGRGGGADAAGPGWGIIGMRERMALLGGTLHAVPRPGGGFAVEAEVPWEARS